MALRVDQQKIQIARRQLGMEDSDYRAVLQRVTGKTSSRSLSTTESRAVIVELERLGFQPQPPTKGKRWRKPSAKDHVRKVYKLWWTLAEAGVVASGHPALNTFIANSKFARKWGESPTDAEFLTVERASDVIEALKDIARRNGVEAA